MSTLNGIAVSVASSARHCFSKHTASSIDIVAGHGVAGDAHAGVTVKHRSPVAVDPTQLNLRQVHLMHAELFDELAQHEFAIEPGELGENITTRGIDLLGLPRGTVLRCGEDAELEVTGLRNPCKQIEAHTPGLLTHVARKLPNGEIERRAGIMAVARHSGRIARNDTIFVTLPPEPYWPLGPV